MGNRFGARTFTPSHPAAAEHIVQSLAIVHVEFVLIHPFREVGRLLTVLMGLQAGLPPLYFDKLSGRKREQYFAVRAGLDTNFEPMRKMFIAVIERTLQIHER